jgi:predicted ester cyclase
MSTEDNNAVTRRFYEEVFDRGNLAHVDEVFDPNYVDHDTFNPMGNLEGFKQAVASLKEAFPDSKMVIEDLISEGDKVVARVTMQGTNTGPLSMGPGNTIPATGKSLSATGIDIIQFAGGKVVEHWGEFDMMGMMQQLGLIPAPA